jgi:hypothetical protein
MFKRFVVGVGKPYSLWLAIALFATAQTAVASDDTVSLRVLGGIGSVSTDYDLPARRKRDKISLRRLSILFLKVLSRMRGASKSVILRS